MKDLQSFRFEAWKDGNHDMCAIHANIAKPDSDVKNYADVVRGGSLSMNEATKRLADNKGILYNQAREMIESARSLSYVWFVLSAQELYNIALGKQTSAVDGYHKLDRMGEMTTFYDMEIPSNKSGEMSVRFYRMTIPNKVWNIFLRTAQMVWARPETGQRNEFHVSQAKAARWEKQYCSGSGDATLSIADNTKEMYAKISLDEDKLNVNIDDRRLITSINYLLRIAKNQTRSFKETGIVYLSKDHDAFYFTIRNPKGFTVMNGGVVNHSKDNSKPDWSIHT